jgi:hypothetical protein
MHWRFDLLQLFWFVFLQLLMMKDLAQSQVPMAKAERQHFQPQICEDT